MRWRHVSPSDHRKISRSPVWWEWVIWSLSSWSFRPSAGMEILRYRRESPLTMKHHENVIGCSADRSQGSGHQINTRRAVSPGDERLMRLMPEAEIPLPFDWLCIDLHADKQRGRFPARQRTALHRSATQSQQHWEQLDPRPLHAIICWVW
jgi:hypothetical protein